MDSLFQKRVHVRQSSQSRRLGGEQREVLSRGEGDCTFVCENRYRETGGDAWC